VLANGWWLSPGTPASSTKTDRHDKAEILLKVALRDNKSINQSINQIRKLLRSQYSSMRVLLFYNIRGHLQLTEDSANYVRYCASRSKINNFTLENEI
jgi:hypothetical protein